MFDRLATTLLNRAVYCGRPVQFASLGATIRRLCSRTAAPVWVVEAVLTAAAHLKKAPRTIISVCRAQQWHQWHSVLRRTQGQRCRRTAPMLARRRRLPVSHSWPVRAAPTTHSLLSTPTTHPRRVKMPGIGSQLSSPTASPAHQLHQSIKQVRPS